VEGITLEVVLLNIILGPQQHTFSHCCAQVEGITLEIMQQALGQAREGRRTILAAMRACAPAPRCQLSDHAPRIGRMQVRGLVRCQRAYPEQNDLTGADAMCSAVYAIPCRLPVGALRLLVCRLVEAVVSHH
jgi:hypothetical protein